MSLALDRQHFARVGAVAALTGAPTLFIATLLHPMSADPSDAPAAFAEYAADSIWVASHLGQFLGFAAVGVAAAAGLQAVDGVALKVMVDRWARATGEARARAFEGGFAVRQVEVGMASLLSLLFALTVTAFGLAMLRSRRFPAWLGCAGLLGGLGTIAAGIAQAYTGFSPLAMALSMPASSVLLLWAMVVGAWLWRLAPTVTSAVGWSTTWRIASRYHARRDVGMDTLYGREYAPARASRSGRTQAPAPAVVRR